MKRRTAFVLSGVGIALACCFGAGYRFLHSARFGAIPSTPSAFAKCSHFHSIVTRKLAILIARGIVTGPLGRFFCII